MTTILLIITVSVLLSGCTKNNTTSEDADMAQQKPFKLTSTAFEDGGRIDLKYTFSDQNLSVPLAWANPPEGTKSFGRDISTHSFGSPPVTFFIFHLEIK
ncbi:outer membrane biogenesis lipoprotein LolB [Paenibacillus anaericanus]|nr:outer membrane biogenesis lipoprotein LolB [Paenibacillus anaericanus]